MHVFYELFYNDLNRNNINTKHNVTKKKKKAPTQAHEIWNRNDFY